MLADPGPRSRLRTDRAVHPARRKTASVAPADPLCRIGSPASGAYFQGRRRAGDRERWLTARRASRTRRQDFRTGQPVRHRLPSSRSPRRPLRSTCRPGRPKCSSWPIRRPFPHSWPPTCCRRPSTDPTPRPILLTPSRGLAEQVVREVERQLAELPRRRTAALAHSRTAASSCWTSSGRDDRDSATPTRRST